MKGAPKAISLFTGAMGLDLGLERAGFEVAVAVECNKTAVETIRANRPSLPVIDRRIEDAPTAEILREAGLAEGEVHLVSGGPSCQAFSTAGHRRSLTDPRGGMFREFLRVVSEAQPRFFVMENVRGLLSAAVRHRPLNLRGPGHPALEPDEELGSALAVVVEALRELDYYVKFDLLNAADYGVPQVRHRLVFIGSRDGEAIAMPQPTHAEDGLGGLPAWRTLRDCVEGVDGLDPDFHNFSPSRLKYLKLVPAGGNWRDLPEPLQAEALGSAHTSWGGRSGFFRRLDMDKPSPSLTTRPDSKATALCHPTELRPLTIGEYAAIQQFPPDWRFSGEVRMKYRQVGNAVPIGLGAAVGGALVAVMQAGRDIDPGRLGRVECDNLELLARLARRPRTVCNPPRMRGSQGRASMADWRGDRATLRADFLGYAPEARRAEAERLAIAGRKKKAGRSAPQSDDTYDLLAAE